MNARKYAQAGIGHVVLLFVIVFVAVVGFAGWKVATMNKVADTAQAAAVTSPKVPDQIKTKADLVQTSKALDDSSSQVDGSLNDSALNADLNDML
jgi:predicted negative regulator of RcsB-dependent stress response